VAASGKRRQHPIVREGTDADGFGAMLEKDFRRMASRTAA
jgi:hypothetical protein